MNARREGIITESLFLRELDNRMGFAVGMPMRQQTVSSSLPVARAAPAVAPHRRRSHFLIPLPHKMPAPAQQIPMPRPTLFSSPPVARAAPAVAPHRRRSRFLIPLPHKMPAPSPTNTHAATDTLLFSARGTCRPGRSTSPSAQPLPYPPATQNARTQPNKYPCRDRHSSLLRTWRRRTVRRYAIKREVCLPLADNREGPKNAKTDAKKSLNRPATTPR